MNLKNIETQISEIIKKIDGFIEKLEFNEIPLEFTPNNFEEGFVSNLENKKGIYFLEIKRETDIQNKEWVSQLKLDWEEESKNIKNSPQIYGKRIKKLIENELEWLPFYIGKSMKIASRIKEHISLTKNTSTYALKLQVRDYFKNKTFRLRFIELNVNEDAYNFIAPEIEKRLREKYNPLVGKQ